MGIVRSPVFWVDSIGCLKSLVGLICLGEIWIVVVVWFVVGLLYDGLWSFILWLDLGKDWLISSPGRDIFGFDGPGHSVGFKIRSTLPYSP